MRIPGFGRRRPAPPPGKQGTPRPETRRETSGTPLPTGDAMVGRKEASRDAALRAVIGAPRQAPLDPTLGGRLREPSAAVAKQIQGSPEFGAATKALTKAIRDPNASNRGEFADTMKKLAASNPHGNIMEVLFLVFRESIEATNEDKRYFLEKLKQHNDMGEALGDYLSELVDVSRELGEVAAGSKGPGKTSSAPPDLSSPAKMSPSRLSAEIEKTRRQIEENEAKAADARSNAAPPDRRLLESLADEVLARLKKDD